MYTHTHTHTALQRLLQPPVTPLLQRFKDVDDFILVGREHLRNRFGASPEPDAFEVEPGPCANEGLDLVVADEDPLYVKVCKGIVSAYIRHEQGWR